MKPPDVYQLKLLAENLYQWSRQESNLFSKQLLPRFVHFRYNLYLSDWGQNCPNNQQSTCGKRGESRHLEAAILSPLTFYNFLPLLWTIFDIVDIMIFVWL